MAFPGTYNFSYYRGDTYQFVVRPKNANGTTFELDAYSGNAVFTIANRRGSGAVQVIATATVDAANDIVTCTITPEQGRQLFSGTSYVYDVQITNVTANPDVVFTLLTGSITVTDDVSGAV
jgi:acetolactate synthase regulatory subunit